MAVSDTASYRTRGIRLNVGGASVAQITSVGSIGGGGAAEIDTTNLHSQAREFELGLPDSGSATVEGIAALNTPAFTVLENAAASGDPQAVEIIFGGIPDGVGLTDGSGIDLASGRSIAAHALTAGDLTITDTASGSLPGVVVGDYINPDEQGDFRIEAISVVGSTATFTLDSSTALNGMNLEYDVVRPAVKYSFSARVSQLERSIQPEEVVRFTMTLRISGALTKLVGTPTVAV